MRSPSLAPISPLTEVRPVDYGLKASLVRIKLVGVGSSTTNTISSCRLENTCKLKSRSSVVLFSGRVPCGNLVFINSLQFLACSLVVNYDLWVNNFVDVKKIQV